MARSSIVRALFFIGAVMIPFDAVRGVPGIGELSSEGSFYFFFMALLYGWALTIGGWLSGRPAPAKDRRVILSAAVALIGCVAITALANMDTIIGAVFRERAALPKLATSTGVLLYGFGLAWLTSVCVEGRWYRGLMVPICVSACICMGFSIFEKADLLGVPVPGFKALSAIVHGGGENSAVLWDGSLNVKMLEGWDKRLRSVSFEPPALGNFTGLAWPWLLCAVMATRGRLRIFHSAVLAGFTVLIIAAQARTGQLLLAANLGSFLVLRYVFLPASGRPRVLLMGGFLTATVTVGLVGIGYYVMSYDAFVHQIVKGTSISDLSRFAYQVTAFRIFLDNPVFGIGLGQFAFQAAAHMPSWGFLSSEIRPALIFPEAPWPNTYSLYARIAAEMGVVGLATWLGIWLALMVAVRARGLALAKAGVGVPPICVAVLMSIVAILASGITTDTFRTPMIWITMGAAARFIAAADSRLKPLQREKVLAEDAAHPGLPPAD